MLYSILKTIIETTIVQYVCQNCQGKINESSIELGEILGNQIHLDITCPHCQSKTHIHAEVANIQSHLGGTILGSTPPDKSPERIIPKNDAALQEKDIEEIQKSLEGTQSIEDLLK
jgi:DNA-directed RNA polymerase subunit RPC12/RpoP